MSECITGSRMIQDHITDVLGHPNSCNEHSVFKNVALHSLHVLIHFSDVIQSIRNFFDVTVTMFTSLRMNVFMHPVSKLKVLVPINSLIPRFWSNIWRFCLVQEVKSYFRNFMHKPGVVQQKSVKLENVVSTTLHKGVDLSQHPRCYFNTSVFAVYNTIININIVFSNYLQKTIQVQKFCHHDHGVKTGK